MKNELHNHKKFLSDAIMLAVDNANDDGGPFGAVIVKDGEVVSTGVNQVTGNSDPTAHAEVQAIRSATKKLNHFQLKGCVLYSSCEPCPMCLGAIYWAGIEKVYFASNRHDAEEAGFSDALIYREISLPIEDRELPTFNLRTENVGEEFKAWNNKENKITY